MVAPEIVLPEGGEMTRGSIQEYAEELRGHYLVASKDEKGRTLDQFTVLTGCHRKAAIRLLARAHRPAGGRRGRPRRYGAEASRGWVVLSIASRSGCLSRCRVWTRATGVSPSTGIFTTTASATASPSPGPGPAGRTTAATWSRGTGRWSGGRLATTATARGPLWSSWGGSTRMCGYTPTPSSRQ